MTKKTRKDEVIALMKRKSGVTVAQICDKTGMQAHSARALISRLDVNVKKTKNGDKPMVYSIVEEATRLMPAPT